MNKDSQRGLDPHQFQEGGITYVQRGSGEPVVFVHGSLADYRFWAPQINALGDEFLVYAPSLRHYWPDDPDSEIVLSVTEHARELQLFLNQVVKRPAHLVGHSRGGAVVLEALRQGANNVKTAILADPVVELSGDVGETLRRDPSAVTHAKARYCAARHIAAGHPEEGVKHFLNAIAGFDVWSRMNSRARRLPLDNAHTLTGQERDTPRAFSDAELQCIDTPILLLNGERSAQVYKSIGGALARRLPQLRYATIASAGHAMSAQKSREFNKLVTEFLLAHRAT